MDVEIRKGKVDTVVLYNLADATNAWKTMEAGSEMMLRAAQVEMPDLGLGPGKGYLVECATWFERVRASVRQAHFELAKTRAHLEVERYLDGRGGVVRLKGNTAKAAYLGMMVGIRELGKTGQWDVGKLLDSFNHVPK